MSAYGDKHGSQSSDNGGRFPQIFGPFQGLKIVILSGCPGETLIFSIIIMTYDVSFNTLWSRLKSTW